MARHDVLFGIIDNVQFETNEAICRSSDMSNTETRSGHCLCGVVKIEEKYGHQVFIDEKPSMYRFANETEDMTGAEVFAKYGSQT